MRVVTDYGPDNDEERLLRLQLAEIERKYRAEVKPLVDRLVQLQALKTPRIVIYQTEPPLDRSGY